MRSYEIKNSLLTNLEIKNPIILAPMAGGISTPELVASVSNAGCLGSYGCAYNSPEEIKKIISDIHKLTSKSFAINLFVPSKDPALSTDQIKNAIEKTKNFRDELEIANPPNLVPPFSLSFDSQFEAVLEGTPKVFSFIFGLLSKEHINECKRNNIITIGTATSLQEGVLLEELGVDAIVAQGYEAGGHRGIFSQSVVDPMISALDLTEILGGAINLPIISAGGLMSSADVKLAMSKGAQAVQLGTAFLLSKEAGTSLPYRAALSQSNLKETKKTRAFSGRLARGIKNRFMLEMDKTPESILPFPAQNSFTRDIRTKATQLKNSDYLSLWAGTGVNLVKELSAKEICHLLISEL